MIASLSVKAMQWWTVLRVAMSERLAYRADFALGTLIRFLPMITQILLWSAVFGSIKSDTVAGYTFHQMVSYYLIMMVSKAFSSMPGLASGIALQIRDGEIKKYLVQPIDLVGFLLLTRVAHKLVFYAIAIFPYALVFWICRDYLPGFPSATNTLAAVAALAMAFLIGFFLETTLGLMGFWLLEVSSLFFVYMLFNFILSGHMIPLDTIEAWSPLAGKIVYSLPLQYTAYFPTAVALGKIQGDALLHGLGIQLAWVLFFILTSRIAYYYGVKRYSGYGG